MIPAIKRTLLTVIAIPLLMQLLFAHGGFEHVLGTVTEATTTDITVKTTEGKTVTVTVDPKTQFTKAGATVTVQDVKPGDRVVIHAKKDGDKLTAQTVQIGAAKGH